MHQSLSRASGLATFDEVELIDVLVKGGVDDASPQKRGYWVPQTSSDQVAADLLLWLGLSPSNLTNVLPNLINFPTKTVGFMNA